jgi:plasmid replication initiation protein
MLPSEWKRLQKAKIEKTKLQPHKKISNNFIESAIRNNTVGAIKTVYYLAALIEKMEQFSQGQELGLLKLDIDTRDMLKFTELTLPDIRRNLKAMQETSITFINEEEDWEEGINLLPYYKFIYGKNKIEVQIFQKVANLIVDVKKDYTMIDTRSLMRLKSKHTLRMLPLLRKIESYSKDVAKRKRMELEDFNQFFGTSYKNLYDVERKILLPVKEELDLNSRITFLYEVNFIQLEKGRPKAHNITIDLIDNSGSLFAN